MRTLPVLMIAACVASAAHATPTMLLTHSGRILNTEGLPVKGPIDLRFELHSLPTPVGADRVLWHEDFAAVPTTDTGVYAVTLGDTSNGGAEGNPPFPGDAFDSDRWLAIKVGNVLLAPWLRITAVPYAVRAGSAVKADDADKLAGLDVAALDARYIRSSPSSVQQGAIHVAGDVTTDGRFVGDGSGLTDIPPAAIAGGLGFDNITGTIPLDRVTGPVPIARVTGNLDATRIDGTLAPSSLPPVSATGAGAMIAADKVKLDGIGEGARVASITAQGPLNATGTKDVTLTLPLATTQAAGAMSAADKSKLDGLPAGLFVVTGASRPPSPAPGQLFFNTDMRFLEVFDGQNWTMMTLPRRGTSCLAIKTLAPTSPSGSYAIDFVGDGTSTDVFCDMDTDGGGWTLVGQVDGKPAMSSTWLRSTQNVANLKTQEIESAAYSCVDSVAFAVNKATDVRLSNADRSRWVKWPLPAGRTLTGFWNHTAGRDTTAAAAQVAVTTRAWNGTTGTCNHGPTGMMPLLEHGGSYPYAGTNTAGNTGGNDYCMAVGVQTTSADGWNQNGNGYDAPSSDTDWPNSAISVNAHVSVWLR